MYNERCNLQITWISENILMTLLEKNNCSNFIEYFCRLLSATCETSKILKKIRGNAVDDNKPFVERHKSFDKATV